MRVAANRSAASVKARLLNASKKAGDEFQHTLERYAIERFLVRVANSEYRDNFVLKGATLYTVWTGEPYRPTRDLDLLARLTSEEDTIADVMRAICNTAVESDGMTFDSESVSTARIREERRYGGIRVLINAYLGKSRIRVQVDVGFGDAVTPGPILVTLPALLNDIPPARINAYNIETVVAEKLEAVVSLGAANSRMKDFYDLWVFSRKFEFDGVMLATAIGNTFRHRKTPFPIASPVALSSDFAKSPTTRRYWSGFLSASGLSKEIPSFERIVGEIDEFATPALRAAESGATIAQHWSPGGPWSAA